MEKWLDFGVYTHQPVFSLLLGDALGWWSVFIFGLSVVFDDELSPARSIIAWALQIVYN